MLVMIDNFDSFTYNLYQYLMQMGAEVRVVRNNSLTVEELEALGPRGLVISPGPGRPEDAGITVAAIQRFSGRIPILGVCLGHQAIALAFGGRVAAARRLMHGKTSAVTADGRELFQGVPSPFEAMRYHSLAVERGSLPACLEVTAEAEDGEIMGLRHRRHPTEGVQFHPESIMTTVGKRLLRNFLKMTHQTLYV
jgi:anthranilate synthase/aminodeoxychorismate synthase-like glutamine amidotransferase